jgi:tetratricopeptide (TPR) repeat protein
MTNFIIAAVVATLVASAASAAPYRPSDDATILVTVPHAAVSAQAAIRKSQIALAANPQDLALALEVARVAIRDGRASADPRRYGQAQAALAPWWSIPDAPMNVRVLRAIIRQSLHDFAGAEADLDAILRLDPRNGQARLTRAFVRQTVGSLADARDDCRRLPASVGRTAFAVCLLRMEALTGAAGTALERLDQVIRIDPRSEPAVRRWAQAVGADMATMLGKIEAADLHFSEATANGGDIPTLVAFADHLLDTDRPAEVLTLLAGRSEADIVYLRLAIAGKRVDDARAPHWAALLADQFAAAKAGGVQLHLREEARFELEVRGDAATALPLALANWKIQKEPSDARLVLQAALAANDPAAAADVLAFIAKTGLADTRIKPLQDKIAEKQL